MLVRLFSDGVPYDPVGGVTLSDPDEMFGLRIIDGDVIAEAGTVLTKVSTGVYEYSFDEEDKKYEYYVKYTIEDTIIHEYHTYTGSATVLELDAFATLEEASEYMASTITPELWTEATEVQRIRSLNVAAKMIRLLKFRDDVDGLEEAQKFANIELALSILDGVDIQEEYNSANIVQATYGGTKYVTSGGIQKHLLYGIPNIIAWRLLESFIIDDRSIRLERVS